jgi:hypothetical protein
MTNPLQKYFRVTKLYVKLTSQTKLYPDNYVNLSVNQELAVYPLSALDLILLKTPDAILNGEALLKVVKNCVPDVTDVKLLVEPDINTILLAIRIASNGETMAWDTSCPNCNKEHTFEINLVHILETQSVVDTHNPIDFQGELRVHVRPYNFEQRNLQMLNEVEESQVLKVINSDDQMTEQDKMKQLSAHVDRMANRTFHVVSQSIQSIQIIQTQETVTDRTYIEEFLKSISSTQADVIIQHIKQLNQTGINTKHSFACDACDHAWEQNLDFDPTSFFG